MLQAVYYTQLALQLWFIGNRSECTTQRRNSSYLKNKAVLPPSALTEKLVRQATSPLGTSSRCETASPVRQEQPSVDADCLNRYRSIKPNPDLGDQFFLTWSSASPVQFFSLASSSQTGAQSINRCYFSTLRGSLVSS